MKNMPMYILTTALLAVAVYLRSPMTAIVTVGLWGISAAETVLARKNRDEDIATMMATMDQHRKKMDALTRDITNVAERARVILGENF